MQLILAFSNSALPVTASVCFVGRSVGADLRLPLPDVSRTHCRLTLRPDGRYSVIDCGSLNNTFVNGEGIQAKGETVLNEGDTLRIGGFQFTVNYPQTDSKAA